MLTAPRSRTWLVAAVLSTTKIIVRADILHRITRTPPQSKVLDAPGSTYASDVYSFGIVAWEVLSRELPWANVARPREVYIYVVLKSLRPDMPVDAPIDIVNMIKACWAGEPDARPTFSTIMQRSESCGWSE